jgi:tetratricopeptide (TPR) repeat protein
VKRVKRDRRQEELNENLEAGTESLKQGNLAGAYGLFIKALSIDSQNLRALNCLGFVLYMQGDFKNGLEICEKAVLIHPDNAYAHKGRGLHLAKHGRISEAIESIQRAIELSPDFIDAYHDLAFVFYEQKMYERASDYIEKGLKIACAPDEIARLQKFKRMLESLSRQ